MQLRSRLKALHKFAAESYEEVFKDDIKKYYGDIAYHYKKAEVEGKAIEYLEKAGDYAEENYHNEDAIGYYSNIIDNYQLSVINYIDVMLKKGRILELIGKWNEAEKIFRECLDKAKEIDNKKYVSKCFNSLGSQLRSKGNYEEAMECFEQDLVISEELVDKRGIGRAVGNMGVVYWNQGDNTKAMECFEKQLVISEELGDKSEIRKYFVNMGIISSNMCDYTNAMECFEKDLAICEELGNKGGICRALGNIGVVYLENCDFTKSMECFEKNLVICEELGDKRIISITVGNMGSLYLEQGDYINAMECIDKHLVMSEELGDKRGTSIAFGSMGQVYYHQGDYDKAMECYNKSISIGKKLNIKYHLCVCLLYKADLLFKLNNPDADSVNKEAFKISLEVDNKYVTFCSNILKEKINYELSGNSQKKKESIENLKSILKDEKEENRIATLNYEIALMLAKLKEDGSKYKNRAIEIYKNLYRKTPNNEFKNRYEELEKLK